MKYLPILILTFAACNPGGEHRHHDDSAGQDSTNILLYNQVMDIHDEVMPRMEELYNLKKDIQEKLKDPSGIAEEQQRILKSRLARIDSVSKMMMDWMHQFNPLPDSVDQEEARAYLESQMEKIRKVKVEMTSILEKAKDEAAKN
jgi:hypothetical protein